MKKYLLLAISISVMLFCFNSCKKNNGEEPNVAPAAIAGSWELESVSGSIPLKNYPAGNGNIFQFTVSSYKKYLEGNLNVSGNYTLVPDATVVQTVGLNIPAGQFTQRIIFDNDTAAQKTFIDILNGKLRFVSGYFPLDGGALRVYAKKAN